MNSDFASLWSAAGIIVGFQVTAFTLRVNREINRSDVGDLTWLPPADYLNLISLGLTLIAVFAFPVVRLVSLTTADRSFGLAVLLLVGYALALAGHYELFNPTTARSMTYFPRQERIVIGVVVVAAIAYITLAAVR